jgi:hypothetical protein
MQRETSENRKRDREDEAAQDSACDDDSDEDDDGVHFVAATSTSGAGASARGGSSSAASAAATTSAVKSSSITAFFGVKQMGPPQQLMQLGSSPSSANPVATASACVSLDHKTGYFHGPIESLFHVGRSSSGDPEAHCYLCNEKISVAANKKQKLEQHLKGKSHTEVSQRCGVWLFLILLTNPISPP